jgi:hypothetical protein
MKIDINRALELEAAGYKHREIGVQLALEQGRPIRYTAQGVQLALMFARRAKDGCGGAEDGVQRHR